MRLWRQTRCVHHTPRSLCDMTDGGMPVLDHLSALPAELSVYLAGFLTLADAHALTLVCRDTPVAASEVLRGERVAYGRLAASPDASDLLRRVGIGRLRRAWGLSRARPYAALCSQLERRLGRALTASGVGAGKVPFAVATCDAPGSLLLVYASCQSDTTALLRAAAGIATDATGRRPALLRSPEGTVDPRWAATADVVAAAAWSEVAGTDARLLVSDHITQVESVHARGLYDQLVDAQLGDAAAALSRWSFAGLVPGVCRSARIVALGDLGAGDRLIEEVCAHLDLSPGELRYHLMPLALNNEWLVVDGWLRRWHRWMPTRL